MATMAAPLSLGFIHPGFNVRSHGVEMTYDPLSEQQLLNFHFALQVSVPQLLNELSQFQQSAGQPLREAPQDGASLQHSGPGAAPFRHLAGTAGSRLPQAAAFPGRMPPSTPVPPPPAGAAQGTVSAAPAAALRGFAGPAAGMVPAGLDRGEVARGLGSGRGLQSMGSGYGLGSSCGPELSNSSFCSSNGNGGLGGGMKSAGRWVAAAVAAAAAGTGSIPNPMPPPRAPPPNAHSPEAVTSQLGGYRAEGLFRRVSLTVPELPARGAFGSLTSPELPFFGTAGSLTMPELPFFGMSGPPLLVQGQPVRLVQSPPEVHGAPPSPVPPQSAPPTASAPAPAEAAQQHDDRSFELLALGQAEALRLAVDELQQAVLQGNPDSVRTVLRQHDFGKELESPLGGSLLVCAVEGSARPDVVKLLLQARCDANAATADGRTPLQVTTSQHYRVSPLVTRMLVSSNADPNRFGENGISVPADTLRVIMQDPAANPRQLRQLAEEFAERPTVSVGVVDLEEVSGARFADLGNDKVVFFTPSVIGFFSVSQNRITLKQRLSRQRVQSVVHSLFVNSELGTIGVFIEVTDAKDVLAGEVQNLIMVWPSGQLQEEEPLKISVDVSLPSRDALPPCIVASTSAARLVMVGRLCGGQVLCWRFNKACSQLVSEQQLVDKGGALAVSHGGSWIAVASPASVADGGRIHIWTCTRLGKVDCIATVSRRPATMALTEQRGGATGTVEDEQQAGGSVTGGAHLALCEQSAGMSAPTIEVLAFNADGSWASVYRVPVESPCLSLSWCFGSSNLLLSAHVDGLVVISDLQTGRFAVSYDDAAIRSASASSDGSLLVTTLADSLRVFRPGGTSSTAGRG